MLNGEKFSMKEVDVIWDFDLPFTQPLFSSRLDAVGNYRRPTSSGVAKIAVSSANISGVVGISFVSSTYNNGLRMLPCGIPEYIG